jgi:hypothetical protein
LERHEPTAFQIATDDEARHKRMYHDDRVLRVMMVADGSGTFIEWIER